MVLCWLTREPVTSLLGGIVSGALVLSRYDFTGDVLIPSLATTSSAGVLLLYLWLLGGLMGIRSRTGAAQAFAEFMTMRFVRGPRSAKLVSWMLGVIFFPGHGQHRAGLHHGQARQLRFLNVPPGVVPLAVGLIALDLVPSHTSSARASAPLQRRLFTCPSLFFVNC